MKVVIVHDSHAGNGERLAEVMKEAFVQAGAEVDVGRVELQADSSQTAGHVVSPDTVAARPPDLLLVGAAIRKFVTSPPSKRWIKQLSRELSRRGTGITHAAVFLTHGLPLNWARKWGERFRRHLSRVHGIKDVYPQWLSGRVVEVSGPLADGSEEQFREHAKALLSRMNAMSKK